MANRLTRSQATGHDHAAGTRRSDERGLITLEWLLIVGAMAGIAAFSVLAVQNVLEGTTDAAPDPMVLVIEAKVAASFIDDDARRALELRRELEALLDDDPDDDDPDDDDPDDDDVDDEDVDFDFTPYEKRCMELKNLYSKVTVAGSASPWTSPPPQCALDFRNEIFE